MTMPTRGLTKFAGCDGSNASPSVPWRVEVSDGQRGPTRRATLGFRDVMPLSTSLANLKTPRNASYAAIDRSGGRHTDHYSR